MIPISKKLHLAHIVCARERREQRARLDNKIIKVLTYKGAANKQYQNTTVKSL